MTQMEPVKDLLVKICGNEKGSLALGRIASLIATAGIKARKKTAFFFFGKDAVLITYTDTLRRQAEAALETFGRFAADYLQGTVSAVHFPPFFPYSPQ